MKLHIERSQTLTVKLATPVRFLWDDLLAVASVAALGAIVVSLMIA